MWWNNFSQFNVYLRFRLCFLDSKVEFDMETNASIINDVGFIKKIFYVEENFSWETIFISISKQYLMI